VAEAAGVLEDGKGVEAPAGWVNDCVVTIERGGGGEEVEGGLLARLTVGIRHGASALLAERQESTLA